MDRFIEHDGVTPLDGQSSKTKNTFSPEKQKKLDRYVEHLITMYGDSALLRSLSSLGKAPRHRDEAKLNKSDKTAAAAKAAALSALWIREEQSNISGHLSIADILKKAIAYYNQETSSKLAEKQAVTHKDVREIVESINTLSYEIAQLNAGDQTPDIKSQIDQLKQQVDQLNAMLAEQKKVQATEIQLNYREIAGGILRCMAGNKYPDRGGYNYYAAYIHDKVDRKLNPLAYVELPTAAPVVEVSPVRSGSSTRDWRERRAESGSATGTYVPIHLRGKTKPTVDKDGFQTVTHRNSHKDTGMSVAEMMRDRSSGFKTEADRVKHVAKDSDQKITLAGDGTGKYVPLHRRQDGGGRSHHPSTRPDSMSQFPSLASTSTVQPKMATGAWGNGISAGVLAEPVPMQSISVQAKASAKPQPTVKTSTFSEEYSDSDQSDVPDDDDHDDDDSAPVVARTTTRIVSVLNVVSSSARSADTSGWTSLKVSQFETSGPTSFVPDVTPDDWEDWTS